MGQFIELLVGRALLVHGFLDQTIQCLEKRFVLNLIWIECFGRGTLRDRRQLTEHALEIRLGHYASIVHDGGAIGLLPFALGKHPGFAGRGEENSVPTKGNYEARSVQA